MKKSPAAPPAPADHTTTLARLLRDAVLATATGGKKARGRDDQQWGTPDGD